MKSQSLRLPADWPNIRAAIVRETVDAWTKEATRADLELAVDGLAAMVSHDVEVADLAGLADKVFAALGHLRHDEVKRKLAFEQLCLSYEAFLRKVLLLTSARDAPSVRDNALYRALIDLGLMTKEDLAVPRAEDLLDRPGHRYGIGRTYELRNKAAHFARDWSSKKVAEGIEHALLAYLQATRARLDAFNENFPRAARLASPLVAHEEHMRGFAGFLEFLRPASLPFVAPDPFHPAHPERLLDAILDRENEGGILLVGAGGAGKTRTSLEVASLGACRANSRAGDRHLDRGPYLIAHGEGLPAVRHRSATASAA